MEGQAAPRGDGRTKELRLAIVCYGGSSLAIYMHGVTKELNRLVKGSALAAAGADLASASPTERVYAELLGQLSEQQQVFTRVVVDVIAGTSAGGINGICLAKALAHNRSQDELRTLWFDHGNIDGLLDTPNVVKGRWPKFAWVATRALKQTPLKGDVMAQWVYDAFSSMDRQQPEPAGMESLLPDDHKLELFVTVTDFYGYGRHVPYADPNPIVDSRHRHVLAFGYGDDDEPARDDFGPDANGPLSFAARTTSCIPGVFPPVSFADFETWLGGRPFDVDKVKADFFRLYELAEFPPEQTWFVDGGVLDNKPFGPAIDAIRERPADVEVDRRLLYLEPDPGEGIVARPRSRPNTVAAAIGALTGLPRAEPILDDLVQVGALNERVERIKDIIVTSWDPVGAKIEGILEEVLGPDGVVPSDAKSPRFAELRKRLDEAARTQAGFSYASYARLKISGVVDGYAAAACAVCNFPPDSSHAQLTRRVIRCWAENEMLFEKSVMPTDRQRQFLIDFDLDYARRRLRFVIDGVSGWYPHVGEAGYPSRDQLDDVKGRLWDALVELRRVMSGAAFDEQVAPQLGTCFPESVMRDFMRQPKYEPQAYVQAHGDDLGALELALRAFLQGALATFTGDLYADLFKRTQGWDELRKRALLSRYLGFEWWDLLLYPIQALSDVGERDRVEVVRLSPRDATRIPSPQPAGRSKLVGAGQHHFGAFLSKRDGREKDYLWGRLDGAERLLGIVLRDAPEADNELWFSKVAAAILEEDRDALPNAGDLVGYVRSKVGG